MAPPKNKFECCQRQTQVNDILKCQTCNRKYHYTCVNVSKTLFKDLTEEYKATWLCPPCCRPKSDNTNTPVRNITLNYNAAKDTDDANSDRNVTLRRKDMETKYGMLSDDCLMEVRNIIREEMNVFMKASREDIIVEINSKMAEILEKMSDITSAINFLENKYEDIKNDMAQKNETIRTLERENKKINQDLSDIKSKLTNIEQYSRASNLEFQCIPEHKNENIITIIKQIATTVQCPINDCDILSCTRLMKMNKESPRPRSVLVKFISSRLRDKFLASTMSFNKRAGQNDDKLNTSHIGFSGNKKPIYVCEHLSPSVKTLHAEARAKAKTINYRYVWVKNGRVFMRKTENSEYVYVKDSNVLSNLK